MHNSNCSSNMDTCQIDGGAANLRRQYSGLHPRRHRDDRNPSVAKRYISQPRQIGEQRNEETAALQCHPSDSASGGPGEAVPLLEMRRPLSRPDGNHPIPEDCYLLPRSLYNTASNDDVTGRNSVVLSFSIKIQTCL